METLRLDFHMGRVECVTCHVPVSQSVVGGVKVEGWGRAVEVGGRRAIVPVLVVVAMAYGSSSPGATGGQRASDRESERVLDLLDHGGELTKASLCNQASSRVEFRDGALGKLLPQRSPGRLRRG